VVGITGARAERFLTVPEAQKLCFPEADRFEEQTVRFTATESAAIEKRLGVKLSNLGHRISLARSGTNLVGILVADRVPGKHNLIDYAVAILPDGRVRQVEILEYRETRGGEIRSEKWRDQFKSKTTGDKLRLNDDISNLSGATISCRSVTDGVRRVLATFELVLRPRLAGTGVLPAPAK
jgi:Na+-translocating ferredoxin:NAD+ oxidoreductase RnfG subunit